MIEHALVTAALVTALVVNRSAEVPRAEAMPVDFCQAIAYGLEQSPSDCGMTYAERQAAAIDDIENC